MSEQYMPPGSHRSVFKFRLDPVSMQLLGAPEGAVLLAVGEQRGELCVWAEVDMHAPYVQRRLYVVGTGSDVPREAQHVGTVLTEAGFVWHIYDGGEA